MEIFVGAVQAFDFVTFLMFSTFIRETGPSWFRGSSNVDCNRPHINKVDLNGQSMVFALSRLLRLTVSHNPDFYWPPTLTSGLLIRKP